MPKFSGFFVFYFAAALLFSTAPSCRAQAPNPPVFFVVHGNIADGDQFGGYFLYQGDSASGGVAKKTRNVPLAKANWGTMSVSASIGAASMTATFEGNMDPVHASRFCNFVYGCGWSPHSEITGSIEVYVRGAPGTRFHLVETVSGSVSASVTDTNACSRGSGNAAANTTWKGDPERTATTRKGANDFCGYPIPTSDSVPISESHIVDGTSTGQTTVYNGETYSYAYGLGTNLSLSIYAEEDTNFTAHSGGSVTLGITANLSGPNRLPPVAKIAPTVPVNPIPGTPVNLDGSGSYDPDGSIAEYKWTIQKPGGGTETLTGATVQYTWNAPGTYGVTLTVTDNDGQTDTATTSIPINNCGFKINPDAFAFGPGGGPGGIGVTTGATCSWTATSNADWLTVSTATASGMGNGLVSYTVAPNPNVNQRIGKIDVSGQTFTATQSGSACGSATLSPSGANISAAGGSGTVAVSGTAACVWLPGSDSPWLTITSAVPGVGNGTVGYSAAPNPSLNSRAGTLTIAGKPFLVNQAANAPLLLACPASTGTIFVPYTSAFKASGGVPPYNFGIAGSLPPGVSLNSSTGVVTGSPTAAGSFPFMGTVMDTSGILPATATCNIGVSVPPCTYIVSLEHPRPPSDKPLQALFGKEGGFGGGTVTASDILCGWLMTTTVPWIHFTGPFPTFSTSFTFTVESNSGSKRQGTLTVANTPFTITQDGTSTCDVPELKTPHSNQTLDLTDLRPDLIVALSCFRNKLKDSNLSLDVTSGYRTQAYQDHLREVWDRWQDLKDNNTPACAQQKATVLAEFGPRVNGKCLGGHCLKRQPVLRSDHTGGTARCPGPLACAFDANVLPPSNDVDALAGECNIFRPEPENDDVHYRLQ